MNLGYLCFNQEEKRQRSCKRRIKFQKFYAVLYFDKHTCLSLCSSKTSIIKSTRLKELQSITRPRNFITLIDVNERPASGLVGARQGSSGLIWARPGSSGLVWARSGSSELVRTQAWSPGWLPRLALPPKVCQILNSSIFEKVLLPSLFCLLLSQQSYLERGS